MFPQAEQQLISIWDEKSILELIYNWIMLLFFHMVPFGRLLSISSYFTTTCKPITWSLGQVGQ